VKGVKNRLSCQSVSLLQALACACLFPSGACFNLAGLLAVSWWKSQTMMEMFRGQSTITLVLIANNAAQVSKCMIMVF